MRFVYIVEGTNGLIGVFSNLQAAKITFEKTLDTQIKENELRDLRRTWKLQKDDGVIYKSPIYNS